MGITFESVSANQREMVSKLNSATSEEIKLAKTLSAMVLAFTIAVLPFTLVCFVSIFITGISYNTQDRISFYPFALEFVRYHHTERSADISDND